MFESLLNIFEALWQCAGVIGAPLKSLEIVGVHIFRNVKMVTSCAPLTYKMLAGIGSAGPDVPLSVLKLNYKGALS